ncbi:hypothetical protein KUCAC02_032000 [Chaenocephalus aceratus]|nr:hypothetical protein KUCAC02_032000 [Chaenocephalus aceratus]
MGCSSGRQTPAPALHPDLDCGNGSEANSLPQDSENQNQALNGFREGEPRLPETLPTLERLAQATGGTEKSWYRCVFPPKWLSVALLCAGVVMLLVAAVCWRAHRLRKRKKKESGFFTADQGTL